MRRGAIWLANGALIVLCALLLARLVTELLAGSAASAPEPGPVSAPHAGGPPASWESRQVILQRNLFKVSTLLPAAPEPVPEDESYAATKLKLTLLGTVAAGDPESSWAAVEDQEARDQIVVRVGDTIQGKAQVERIDRRRIVLRNQGRLEELALSDTDEPAPARSNRSARSARRPQRRGASLEDARENLAKRREELQEQRRKRREERAAAAQANTGTASLFSQARIVPRYEDGEIVGMRLDSIKPGSVFENLGIVNGDTITELNGIPIVGPEQSVQALQQFADGDPVDLKVKGSDGSERTVRYEP